MTYAKGMRIRNSAGKRWILVSGFVLLGLLVVGVIHQVSSMAWAVGGVRSDTIAAADAITQGDLTRAKESVDKLVDSSTELATVSNAGLWSLATHLPVVGASVSSLGVMSEAVATTAQAIVPVLDQLAQAPSNTARVVALANSSSDLTNLAVVAEDSQTQVGSLDPSQLRFGLSDLARDLQTGLPVLAAFAEQSARASAVLPRMVGMDGPTTWLVMLQNAGEARGSGGLFSAFALVRFDAGEFRIVEANTRKAGLDDESVPKVAEIPFTETLEPSSIQLWGDYPGEWASFNLSADFPTVAKLAAAGMAQRGTPVDGVVAIDAEVVSALLAGTGPVEHKGIELDADIAAKFFLSGIYEDFPGFTEVEEKDQLAMGLMFATINSILQRPLNLPSLANSLAPVVDEGHIKMWSADPAQEQLFEELGVSGELASLNPETIAVAFNNAVGGKLDLYLDTEITLDRGTCVYEGGIVPQWGEPLPSNSSAWVQSTISVDVTNAAPADLPEYVTVRLDDPSAPVGSTATLVHIYGPADAQFLSASVLLDGEAVTPIPFVLGQEAGRPVWGALIDVDRLETGTFAVRFIEPQGSTGGVISPGNARELSISINDNAAGALCS
jgi:hypothetical protein